MMMFLMMMIILLIVVCEWVGDTLFVDVLLLDALEVFGVAIGS